MGRSRSPARWAAATVALLAAVAPPGAGADLQRLLVNEVICDASEALCIRGTLTHDRSSRALSLIARVQRSTRPGTAVLRLHGHTFGGQPAHAEIRFRTRGRHSEIIDKTIIPGPPDALGWAILDLLYVPDG